MKVLVAVAISTTDPPVVPDIQCSETMTALRDAATLRSHSGDAAAIPLQAELVTFATSRTATPTASSRVRT
ncbi:MAG: hypothetical protein GY708_08860 [Actinomycetia bacterium]|nr:hypothetical protein [Actinomycetes bacterium]MCP4958727.1 hypothetical protein [Actinomycetes bacterium]